MNAPPDQEKRAFISYVHENGDQVDKLCKLLDAAGIPYWRDRKKLGPGDKWKAKIRQAIQSGSMVFLACFSKESRAKETSHTNEELNLAVEEYRRRPPDRTWLIPVRFDDGEIPDWPLGAGQTIQSELNYVDLFGDDYPENAVKLVGAIHEVMGERPLDAATVRAAVDEAADPERPAMLRRLTEEMIRDPAQVIQMDALVAQEHARILAAMRDSDRFPTSLPGGDQDAQILTAAAAAQDYWQLVEAFCYSLQVAARWAPNADSLRPWANAVRSFAVEAEKPASGYQIMTNLRYIPALITTFVAALACTAQPRWDNLKTLLVDNTLPSSRRQRAVPIVDTVDPSCPFQISDLVPNVLAHSAVHRQHDPAAALTAVQAKSKFKSPTAEWLHRILRDAFSKQLPDDEPYDNAFDRAEVILGLLSEDESAVQTAGNPELAWLRGSKWYGRSAWRAHSGYGHPNALDDIAHELTSLQDEWGPVANGLFGGSATRATDAVNAHAENFRKAGSRFW